MSRFCFSLHTVRYQSHRMPRIEPWEQTKTTAHLKKENGMEELGIVQQKPHKLGDLPSKAPQLCHADPVFTDAFAEASAFLVQRVS